MLIVSSLVFLSVVLIGAAAFMYFSTSRAEQRLLGIAAMPEAQSNWTETFVKLAGPFAKLSTPDGAWESSPLRIKFFHAGIRNPEARVLYFGLKGLLPLAFAATVFFGARAFNSTLGLGLMMWMLIAALIGCYLPNLVVHMLGRSRQREVFENFPDAADLMLVCVEAGLGLDAALTRVADEMRRKSLALAEELHLTNLEMRAGGTREKALHNLALRTGVEEVGTFATMLTQAEKFGTSIGDSLRVFSDDLRHKRQMAAEERAAKIPTKMLFPLVCFIFPSVIVVILGPAMITIIRTVMPMLAGK
ncbi:MAG TPA: type II secretion system F family protein [Acetobacteraceae bacterium]|nr:type II secretion system F family protein [Acetobacteraceae bacterium]